MIRFINGILKYKYKKQSAYLTTALRALAKNLLHFGLYIEVLDNIKRYSIVHYKTTSNNTLSKTLTGFEQVFAMSTSKGKNLNAEKASQI